MKRPRPVVILTGVAAVIGALIATAGVTNMIPKQAMGYLILCNAIVTAVLGVVAQSKVTPLSDPRNGDGLPLVPAVDRNRPVSGA